MENFNVTECEKRCQKWLDSSYFSDRIKSEIRHMGLDDINESFNGNLEFGTGGMRGIMGPGTNRMNIYTVRHATQGIANYILKNKKQKMGVVVGYDTRHNSYTFAKETALCFAANGIKAYLMGDVSPTPLVSFAVRKLKTYAGVNVTASHNTKEYNGYKVYLEDGAQFSSPEDLEIIKEIEAITDYTTCKTMTEKEAIKKGLLIQVPESIWKDYLDNVYSCVVNPKAHEMMRNKLSIVYTPLHGVGEKCVSNIINRLGYKKYFIVQEQNDRNGDFKTVASPNPENESAFEMALSLAKEKKADIVIATDPDSDRLGVCVRKHNGEYEKLTGNMLASIFCEYLHHFEPGIYDKKDKNFNKFYIVKSFVTTTLMDEIAAYYNTDCKVSLTGFKWIAKEIHKNELLPKPQRKKYIFSAEESYGCIIKDYTRDKDAVAAALMAIEVAAFFKIANMNLFDVLELMYQKYGYIFSDADSFVYKGFEGKKKMEEIMKNMQAKPLTDIAGIKVVTYENYNTLISYNMITNESEKIDMPKTNAIIYKLEDGSSVSIRPSGTEPKIKLYYLVKDDSREKTLAKIELFKNYFHKMF